MTQAQFIRRAIKPAVFVGALVPFALLVRDAFGGGLGANPVEEITHRTGITALTLLVLTLAVTPLRALTGIASIVLLRRMVGLFAFFYVTLHFLTYLFDQYPLSLETVVDDVAKRAYITVGFASFLLLIPLALTSTKGWVKRLGGARWQHLHRLVYVAAGGAVVHFLWKVKAEEARPVVYGLIVVALLGFRLWALRRPRRARSRRRSSVEQPSSAPSASSEEPSPVR
jgi:sulfoxide reductase heme-binding subunit YedZ